MADLICILCKVPKGARVASSVFLIWTPQRYQNCNKRCMDGNSREPFQSVFHVRANLATSHFDLFYMQPYFLLRFNKTLTNSE